MSDSPKPTAKPKRGRGRPRKPAVIRNSDGSCSVRTTVDIDGLAVRKQLPAHTRDRVVAFARGKQLARGEAAEVTDKRARSFEQAAREIVEASTIKTKKTRLRRLETYAFPVFGDMPVGEIKVDEIKAALEQAAKRGGWTQMVRHLKNDISAVLGTLYEREIIDENRALRIKFCRKDNSLGGRKIKRVVPPRMVLTDEQFERLIAHGLAVGSGQLDELHMLALCARCLGGMRTSDLHAWRWDHVDLAGWQEALVPRPKTRGDEDENAETVLKLYELPADLVPHLGSWWRRHGCPTEGPIFPVRRGSRAGLHKQAGTSYAEPLREALWAAGVVWPLPGYRQDLPEAERRQLCALQAGDRKSYRKRARLDFHSFRRAFVTATSSLPELSMAESMELADHHDYQTHLRYRSQGDRLVTPQKVIPRIMAPSLPIFPNDPPEILNDSLRVRKDSNLRPTAPEAHGRVLPGDFAEQNAGAIDHVTPGDAAYRQKSAAKIPVADAVAAAVGAAMAAGNLELAAALVEAAKMAARSAAATVEGGASAEPATGVIEIADFRKSRGA